MNHTQTRPHSQHSQQQPRPQQQPQQQPLATWPQIVSFLERNPFQEKTLTPYVKPSYAIEGAEGIPVKNGWTLTMVEPPTPLSCLLVLHDAEYASSTPEGRRVLLRERTTELQEKATTHLKGRAWPVRKTADGLVAVSTSEKATEWSQIGLEALAELYECQIVLFDTTAKTASFIPADPRNWSRERPVYFLRKDGRAVWDSPDGWSSAKLGAWCDEKEQEGWTLAYPVAKGTLAEMKVIAEKDSYVIPLKVTKDVYAEHLGRAQTIRLFVSWEPTT